MISRLWGIPAAVAGLIAAVIVLRTGWTCPTGGTEYCSHAYIAGTSALVLVVGFALFVLGIAIAVGDKRRRR